MQNIFFRYISPDGRDGKATNAPQLINTFN